ncbi:unnamed protein product [Hymenolepis diminuta]|uniref:Uncharacterized protein n=1 Tax=Hymenolepis diminuta TaxID=6216 RepID=A0A564Z2Q5_HYMDI|nr:unnamed protein product [Hymenolepis diminuta]
MLSPVLRSKVLSNKTRAQLLETFFEFVHNSLSTIVCNKIGDNKLKVIRRTAR